MIFNLSTVNLINSLFIAAGVGVCLMCFLQITSASHLRHDVRRGFQIFFLILILYISAHLARDLMNGLPGDGIRKALKAVTFVEMQSAGAMACGMSYLMLAVAQPDKSRRGLEFVLSLLLFAHVTLVNIAAKTDFIYYFDAENVYHRSAGYLTSNVGPLLMMIVDTVVLIRFRKKIDRRVRGAFWIYLIAPLIAILVQSFSYGIQFIILATVGAAVYMFSAIVRNLNEKYAKQQMDSSRIEAELTMASSIQADMLPNIYPAFPERTEFDIYASMDPAKEVGGDFYDFFLVDDDHLCIVMADVSGKGVPAALFMMASKIILANNALLGKSPAQILTDTNAAICSNNRGELFVTVWLGILELSTGKLTASNAGHEYPALRHKDGSFELVRYKHSFVVGGLEKMEYTQYELQLEPGSKLFLYTDGVPEATDKDNKAFGTERMLDALNEDADASPKELLSRVKGAVDRFVKSSEQFDDLTMLCFEFKEKSKGAAS